MAELSMTFQLVSLGLKFANDISSIHNIIQRSETTAPASIVRESEGRYDTRLMEIWNAIEVICFRSLDCES